MTKINNCVQRTLSSLTRLKIALNNIGLLLLLPWLLAYGGCMFGENKEPALKSEKKLLPKGDTHANFAPSATPLPEKSPQAATIDPDLLPPSYDEVMAADNKGAVPSKKVDKNISKEEAKKRAEACHKKGQNLLKKCLKYERNISDKEDAEKWWKEFSEGWFMKRWIGNSILQSKRREKSEKGGLLRWTLNKAEEHLKEMAQYTNLAIQQGSKKKGFLLEKKRETLRGQVLNIRNAMAEHIKEIGVGHKVDPQIQDTPGIWPTPLR